MMIDMYCVLELQGITKCHNVNSYSCSMEKTSSKNVLLAVFNRGRSGRGGGGEFSQISLHPYFQPCIARNPLLSCKPGKKIKKGKKMTKNLWKRSELTISSVLQACMSEQYTQGQQGRMMWRLQGRPRSTQWYPVTAQGAMGRNWNTGGPSEHQETLTQVAQRGCAISVLWRYSKPKGTESWTTSSSWACLSRLNQMASRGASQTQTICDSVKMEGKKPGK